MPPPIIRPGPGGPIPSGAGDVGDLDLVIRLQTGVRGYLDFQDKLNHQQTALFSEIFRPAEANLDLVFVNVLEAAKFAVGTEIKVRESQRLAKVGRGTPITEATGSAQEFNRQAMRSARRALDTLRESADR